MRIRLLLSTCALLSAVVLASPAAAQSPEDYHIEGGVDFWKPNPGVVIRSGAGGTDVDLVNLLGIEDKTFPDFHVIAKPARKHKIRFQYVQLNYDKEAVIRQTVVFAGQTFNINVLASTDIEWTLMRFMYEWDFVSNDTVFAGVIGGIKYNKVKASLTAASVNVASVTDQTAPIPAIGGIVRGYVTPNLSLTGELTGVWLPSRAIEDVRAHYMDIEFYGTYNFTRNVGAQIGFRSFDLGYVVDEDIGDFDLRGIYFGIVARY